MFNPQLGYKKAGVVISKLIPASASVGSLFADTALQEREHRLSEAIDRINATYGRGTLKMAVQSDSTYHLSDRQSPHYTTRWEDLPKASVK